MTAEAEAGAQASSYQVVVNHEEQFSIWPADTQPPMGWRSTGVTGTRDECLAHIDKVWTDITPLSVRTALRAAGQ